MLICCSHLLQFRLALEGQLGGAGHDDAVVGDPDKQAAFLQADLHFGVGKACLMAQDRRGAGAGAAGQSPAAAPF